MATALDFTQSREIDPGFKAPAANFGSAHAFEQAFKQGWESNFTGMGLRALKYWKLKTGAELLPEGGDFIDKETFDRDYSLGGALKFVPHHEGQMARSYAQALMDDRLDDEFERAKSGLSFAPIASFTGSLAGGLLSPVDIAVNLAIPEYAFAKFGMGATVASRAGTGVARIVSRTINGAVNGAAQAAAFQVPMAALASHNQTEYTLQDAISNMALGPVMGAGAGLLHGVARHVVGEWDRSFANAVMHAAATDKDPSVAANIARNDPRFAAAMEQRGRIRDLLQHPERSPQADADLVNMAGPNPPENMTDAVLFGRGREQRAATRKIIDEVLANPQDQRIRLARSDDERFLAEAWKTLFGVDLKFVNKEFARQMGFLGFTRPSEPTRAYITEGALNDGTANSMMFVAGHELAHSVRMRDPVLWDRMVTAMMETSKSDDGALASAWRKVTAYSRGNSVWAGLDLPGKMDETFATVFGSATQSRHFWDNIRTSSPQSVSRLAGIFIGVRRKLQRLIDQTGMTAQTRALYEGLSQAIYSSGIDEKTVTVPEALKLAELYSKHRPGFRKFTEMMSAELNERGLALESELADFVSWHNEMFPEVATLEDNSATPNRPGRFSTILRNRHIDSNNPGLWLLQNIFSRAKEGTKEHELAVAFAQGTLNWDKKSRTAKGLKDYAGSAFTKHGAAGDRKYNALAAFKRNTDGTWDIGIFRNDDFPKWHELLPKDNSDVDYIARAFVEDELHAVRSEFDAFVNGTKNKESTPAPTKEFHEYLGTLNRHELDAMVHDDPDALWQGFAEFLEEKAAEYRLSNDPKSVENLSEIRRAVDPLLKAHDGKAGENVDPKALNAAWEEFRKAYSDIQEQLSDRNLERTSSPAPEVPTKEFFEELFKQERQLIINEASEVRQVMDRLRSAREGDFGLQVKGRQFFARDSAKLDARMEAAIDQMAHDRLAAQYPQYAKVMKIADLVDEAHGEEISIHTANPDQLPALHRDASEQFDEIADPFADLSDDLNFMAAPSTPRRLTAEEAAKLARVRLDRDHSQWSKFLTSFETAADALINEKLSQNGAEGWTLDPTPAPAAGESAKPAPSGPLVDDLERVKSSYGFMSKALDWFMRGEAPDSDQKKQAAAEIAERYDYHTRQGLDRHGARMEIAKELTREAQAKILQAITNHEASRTLTGRAKAGLDSLYSYLDGIARKGVKAAGASVSEAMGARVTADTAPMARELVNTGLDTLWLNNDETLIRAVILGMKNAEAVKDPLVKRLVDTLKKTQEAQTGRLNSLGANIRLLQGYTFSQVHNPYAIGRDVGEYIADVAKWLDWDATERAHGPNTPEGVFDRGLYLKQLQFELAKTERPVSPGFNPDTMGGNIANRVSHRRTLHFLDTHALDYDMKYGSGNTSGLIMEQLVKRAELATVMERFGADYKKVWNGVMDDLGRAGKWRWGKLGRIDMTFQGLVGDLNHPEDVKLAAIGQATRQAMNSVALWMSGVSSLTDIGNATATMRWMGVSPRDMHSHLYNLMKEHAFKGPKDREFLLAQGAGLQALLSAFSRTQVMDGPLYRMAQKASDFTFKYNGQEIWTKTLQSAFHDLTTQHLGDMASGKPTPEFVNWLSHYGITKEEWSLMAKHSAEIEGLAGTRLAPDMIPDSALAQKLRVAINDSMHQAILEPTASDRALLTMGTKAGTRSGEAMRTLMQYKGYPLAMVRRIQRRFANAYGNEGLWAFGSEVNRGQLDWLIWAGSMLSLSATVLSIKDIMRGREPLNPFDTDQWTIGNASRIVSQAGVGPFAVVEQFLSPHQALGPAFGTAYSVGSGMLSGNGYRATNAVIGAMPGSSIAPLKEASKAILGSIFTETYGVHYQQFLRRLEDETGQTSIFLDK